MTKAMDAGDIYARVTTPLGKDETMAELNQRLLVLSKQLVKENLRRLYCREASGRTTG